MNSSSRLLFTGICFLQFLAGAQASTEVTLGSGSAVTSIDRTASFNAVTSGMALSDYTENRLFIGANADAFLGSDVFQGTNGGDMHFYCLDGGSMGGGADSWVTIQTTDAKKIFGLEFVYSNSWSNGNIYGQYPWGNSNAWVTWQTLIGSTVVSSGQIGIDSLLALGTVVGFYDPNGFDTLQLKCNIANQSDPAIQALAMDNLHVQVSAVPEPAAGLLGLIGVGVLFALRRAGVRAVVEAVVPTA